jgi:tetratricopeptide (TPR) repeat protein
MPTHIYVRLGDWDGVVRGNALAAEAAKAQPAGEHGEYVWDEFPHAIEYLVYGYLQQGKNDSAAAWLARLEGTDRLEPSFKTAFHLASSRARYTLERRAWQEAAEIRPREPAGLAWDRFPWAEAVSRLARGLGLVHLKRVEDAGQEATRLAELEDLTRTAGEELFARNIRVLRLELDGWLAQRRGQSDSARAFLEEAVTIEASTPKHAVTPGPTLPALELLGDLYLEQRRPADALRAYEQSLAVYPGRRLSLQGVAQARRLRP